MIVQGLHSDLNQSNSWISASWSWFTWKTSRKCSMSTMTHHRSRLNGAFPHQPRTEKNAGDNVYRALVEINQIWRFTCAPHETVTRQRMGRVTHRADSYTVRHNPRRALGGIAPKALHFARLSAPEPRRREWLAKLHLKRTVYFSRIMGSLLSLPGRWERVEKPLFNNFFPIIKASFLCIFRQLWRKHPESVINLWCHEIVKRLFCNVKKFALLGQSVTLLALLHLYEYDMDCN